MIQRKISHGVQSATTTLRQQGRDVWKLLEQSWIVYHRGGVMPSTAASFLRAAERAAMHLCPLRDRRLGAHTSGCKSPTSECLLLFLSFNSLLLIPGASLDYARHTINLRKYKLFSPQGKAWPHFLRCPQLISKPFSAPFK